MVLELQNLYYVDVLLLLLFIFFMAVTDNFYGFYGLAFEKGVGNWLGAL